MRFSVRSSKPDLVLGEKFVPGSDSDHFCKPTDVAVLSTGEFFVSDGFVLDSIPLTVVGQYVSTFVFVQQSLQPKLSWIGLGLARFNIPLDTFLGRFGDGRVAAASAKIVATVGAHSVCGVE